MITIKSMVSWTRQRDELTFWRLMIWNSLGGGGGVDDEMIEVCEISIDEAREMVKQGTSHTSPPGFLFGILWFLTNKASKFEKWIYTLKLIYSEALKIDQNFCTKNERIGEHSCDTRYYKSLLITSIFAICIVCFINYKWSSEKFQICNEKTTFLPHTSSTTHNIGYLNKKYWMTNSIGCFNFFMS